MAAAAINPQYSQDFLKELRKSLLGTMILPTLLPVGNTLPYACWIIHLNVTVQTRSDSLVMTRQPIA